MQSNLFYLIFQGNWSDLGKCGGHKLADGVRFELTVRENRTSVFKTGALNRSATHPRDMKTTLLLSLLQAKYTRVQQA